MYMSLGLEARDYFKGSDLQCAYSLPKGCHGEAARAPVACQDLNYPYSYGDCGGSYIDMSPA